MRCDCYYRYGMVLASIILATVGFGCAPGSPLDPGGDTGRDTPIGSVIPAGAYSGSGQVRSLMVSGAETDTLRAYSTATDTIILLASFGDSGEILAASGEALKVGDQKTMTFLLQDPTDGTKLIGEPVTVTVTSIAPTTTGLIVKYDASMNTIPPQGGSQVVISGTEASETYTHQEGGTVKLQIQVQMGRPVDQPRLNAILSGEAILAK